MLKLPEREIVRFYDAAERLGKRELEGGGLSVHSAETHLRVNRELEPTDKRDIDVVAVLQ